MKKLLTLLLIVFVVAPYSYAEDRALTLGDMMTLYFTEIFPSSQKEVNDIVVKYSGIGNRFALRSALQRAIYYGMLPNIASELHPDTPMTDREMVLFLKKDFGVSLSADASPLTLTDYHTFMQHIRPSFAYKMLQSLAKPDVSSGELIAPQTSRVSSARGFYVFDSVYTILHENYLKSRALDEAELIYGATEGMVNQLNDPHTKFFRPAASTDFQNSLGGNIVGIGVIIDVDPQGYLVITDVIHHSPADKVGILPQDRITKIGSIPVTTEDGIDDDISRLRGEKGTTVVISVLSGNVTKTFSIVRDVFQIDLVTSRDLNQAYFIKFGEVALGTDKLFRSALEKFIASGKKRLIIDLRSNPGGSLTETRNILNAFIDRGNSLFVVQYPRTENTNIAQEKAMTDWSRYEIVLLVNRDTASAAEVIAASLREYFPKNVALVGDTTYGKGTVQELIPFDDKSLLKYTVARWLTPKSKTSINGIGLKPDLAVSFDQSIWKTKKMDTQLLAAEKYSFMR